MALGLKEAVFGAALTLAASQATALEKPAPVATTETRDCDAEGREVDLVMKEIQRETGFYVTSWGRAGAEARARCEAEKAEAEK